MGAASRPPAGRSLAARIEAELVEFWREMLPDLSTAEIEACVQVLDRVEAALGEEGAALSLKRPQNP